MLKYRFIFGTLMTIAFVAIVLLDPWKPLLLVVLVAALMIPGLLELSKLAATKSVKILLPVSIPASVLMATSSYWLPRLTLTEEFIFFFTEFCSHGVFSVSKNSVWLVGSFRQLRSRLLFDIISWIVGCVYPGGTC